MQSFYHTVEWYEVGLETGSTAESTTSSNVFMRLVGCSGRSPVYWLVGSTASRDIIFLPCSIVFFMVPLPKHIGKPCGIHIWHDNTGKKPSWFLRTTTVRHILSCEHEVTAFSVRRWLSQVDNKPYVHLSIDDTPCQVISKPLTQLSKSNMLEIFKGCVYEYHLWLGFFSSSPLSQFSKQRRTLCGLFSVLLILSITVFMNRTGATLQSRLHLFCWHDYCLKDHHIFSAVQVVFLSILPRIICCAMFERVGHSSPVKADALSKNGTNQGGKRKSQRYYRMRCSIKSNRAANRAVKRRAGSEKRSHGMETLHGSEQDGKRRKLEKEKWRGFEKRFGLRKEKLPVIPENAIINLRTPSHFLPEVPKQLVEWSEKTHGLSKCTVYILNTFLLVSSGIFVYYTWSKSRSWNSVDDRESVMIFGVALTTDIFIVQFIRPFVEYIRLVLANQNRMTFNCPFPSARKVFIDICYHWGLVHNDENRTVYLEKVYGCGISMPVFERMSDERESSKRRNCLKELLFTCIFMAILAFNVTQGIDPSVYDTTRYMQQNLMPEFNISRAVSMVCMNH